MITLPTGTKIWIIAGITDMRCGFNGLASKVQNTLKDDPFSGHIFVFRGRSGKMVKTSLQWEIVVAIVRLTRIFQRLLCKIRCFF